MKSVTYTPIVATLLVTCSTFFPIVEASWCTLCKGSDKVPNPEGVIGLKTCQALSMESIWLDEGSDECQSKRDGARFVCGCETEVPSIMPSSIPSSVPSSTPSSVPSTMTSNVPSTMSSSSPSLSRDKAPDCQGLMAGTYPFFPSDVTETLVLEYQAELDLVSIVSAPIPTATVSKFQDASSRFVSADAVGCFDKQQQRHRQRRLIGSHQNNEHQYLRRIVTADHKVHYVKFIDMTESSESCSTTSRNTCHVINGKISVVYSSPPSQTSPSSSTTTTQEEITSWAEQKIIQNAFQTQANAITNAIDEINSITSIQIVNDTIQPRSTSSAEGTSSSPLSSSTTIGVSAGLSAAAVAAFILSIIIIRRKRRGNHGQSRKLRKKEVERVDIISKFHVLSDDDTFGNEYVEVSDIKFNGDDSISNAPTVECKKVRSLESDNNLTQTSSYGSSNSGNKFYDDDDESSVNLQEQFPLRSLDHNDDEEKNHDPSQILRMEEFKVLPPSPYDEAESIFITRMKSLSSYYDEDDNNDDDSHVKNNNVYSNNLFINDDGEEILEVLTRSISRSKVSSSSHDRGVPNSTEVIDDTVEL